MDWWDALVQLNTEQQIAVDSRAGRVLVVAAPGSGKTRVIVKRVLDIIEGGTPPRKILSTTFTKEAAEEMKNRAAHYLLGTTGSKVPQSRLDKIKLEKGLEVPNGHHVFCTFHSLAYRFIRHHHHDYFGHIAPQIVASNFELGRAIRIALREAGLELKQKKGLTSFISTCKRKRVTPTGAKLAVEENLKKMGNGADLWTADQFADAYGVYETELRKAGVFDFDSLLVEMANLLEKNEGVRSRWQYQYVQVDEAQDTDVLQWAIVDMVTQQYKNLFCVGDENQGMYSFRGAESELQAKFTTRYPDARVLILPENYRSTKSIVDYCREIAPEQNDTIKSLRTANVDGVPPVFIQYGTEEEETMWVLKKVTDVPNTAILSRTNAQLQPYEDACTDHDIPFHILGKGGFWRQHEVETCMALVRCLVAPTVKAIEKTIRSPYPFMRARRDEKDEAILWIESKAKNNKLEGQGLLNAFRSYHTAPFTELPKVMDYVRTQGSGPALLNALFKAAGVTQYYTEKDGDEDMPDNDRLENISRLVHIAGKFPTLNKFVEFAERVRHKNHANKMALTLSTIHKAKGLEWQDVFVVGVNEGKLPSAYSTSDAELKEEQRVYFVACSRAARSLHVSCNGEPSRFIVDRVESRVLDKKPEEIVGRLALG